MFENENVDLNVKNLDGLTAVELIGDALSKADKKKKKKIEDADLLFKNKLEQTSKSSGMKKKKEK